MGELTYPIMHGDQQPFSLQIFLCAQKQTKVSRNLMASEHEVSGHDCAHINYKREASYAYIHMINAKTNIQNDSY